jgi:hypothetical protein
MINLKITGLIFTLLILAAACEELPDPAGKRGVAVVPAITGLNPGVFDSKDLENSYIEFTITVPEGTDPDKITVVASFRDNFERIVMTEATSFPATVRIKSKDVIEKLGLQPAEVENGDIFTFELLTRANGITTRSVAVLSVPVACGYDVTLSTGSYHCVSPDWGSDGSITLAADNDNPYKIYISGLEEIEGLVEDLGPLVMYIDPATYGVTAPLKAIASEAWGYGAISYAGSGVYSSCTGNYTMHFEISLEALGSVGQYSFTFTRNQ